MTERGVADLRDLAAGIHPAILTNRGLEAAVAALVDGLPVHVDVRTQLPERLPEAVEASAYFFVSEALTNVVKHSSRGFGRSRGRTRSAFAST